MGNIAAVLQYDGTRYHGWQRQQNAITVAQLVEEAIGQITAQQVPVTGCSRTDAGVHALEYVCNFRVDCSVPVERLHLALNTKLPPDIRVLSCHPVEEDFHARFSVLRKTYEYQVDTAAVASPFLQPYSYHFPYPLQVEDMQAAAAHIVGTHDFSAFMAMGSDQTTTVRRVEHLTVRREGRLLGVTITADAYLYNMVRIIAGTLLYVGCGKIAPGDIPHIIQAGDRTLAGITAPPQGLFLKRAEYAPCDLDFRRECNEKE